MAATEVNARWQADMAKYFIGLDGRGPDESFVLLDEIFNLDDQLRGDCEGSRSMTAARRHPAGTGAGPRSRRAAPRSAWSPAASARTGRSSPTCCRSCSARRAAVSERMQALDCDVVDVGFISDAEDGARAAEQLRVAGCDLIVGFLTTYMTASMLAPIAQRSGAPVLLINLQPTEAMDHATFDTGQWLAYCGACPLPEMANTFLRLGVAVPLGVRLPRGRAGLGEDRPLDQGGRRARRAAHTAGTA